VKENRVLIIDGVLESPSRPAENHHLLH
jgi:hypothetical protein